MSQVSPRRALSRGRFGAFGLALACLARAVPAAATTTLTVDLGATLGPVTHAASGSLYGVTETLPADVQTLIAPLHPNMFTNPAANVQQPRGDAIVVAGRLASTGARVTIRLADWFPSWPYAFTNMSDWFDKLGQTAARKQASAVDNYYGYEIWNEPDGTWTNAMSFNDFWQQSYAKLRALDPSAKLIGPSLSYYDSSRLKDFLTYAKANACVPDIVSWHELSGGNISANVQSYRALEQQLGIGPLPISINEYSGKARIDDEGRPGASAPIIAKFERARVDTACISYWDVAHAGRLGSLLASDTAPNGGFWFYKWYGDMSGSMVSTTPPSPNDAAALDGFANLDSASGTASVLFAGVNDGTIQIVVKAIAAGTDHLHAVVERTPFVNRTTAVSAPTTVSMSDVAVSGGQISIQVASANDTDGYRLSLTGIAGGAGSGGSAGNGPGAGGRAGMGGRSGVGGTGAGGNGGEVARGGNAGDAGMDATGGVAARSGDAGLGGRAATAGARATGGSGAGGVAVTGGSSSVGGRGGTPSGFGGALASDGSPGGKGATAGAAAGMSGGAGNAASGCGCRVVPESAASKASLGLAVLGLVLLRSRSKRRV